MNKTPVGLPVYAEMKDSGVEWLGRVPAHWSVKKLRQCAAILGGMTPSMNVRRFWDGEIRWVTPKDMKEDVVSSSQMCVTSKAVAETPLRLIGAPAVLMVVRGMILARRVPVARTTAPVTINQDMKALVSGPEISAGYLAAYLACARDGLFPLIDEAGHGTRRLPTHRWRELGTTVPPLSEQSAIVRFLDYVGGRIRGAIREKEKLLALLEEQRLAVIKQAVTGQIDVRTGRPYPAYKDFGTEWLSRVPAHWRVKKLRQCVAILGGMTPSMDVRRFWGGEIPWVTPKDMKADVVADSKMFVTSDALAETSLRLIDAPAVLMVVRGMILARKVPVARTIRPVTINQDMKALVCGPEISTNYLTAYLACAHNGLFPLIDEAGHGTRRLPTERWRELATAVPPLPEQNAITRYVDRVTADTAAAKDRADRQVSLLREYRVRLIADVVAGKVDVREAAANLPKGDPLDTVSSGAATTGSA